MDALRVRRTRLIVLFMAVLSVCSTPLKEDDTTSALHSTEDFTSDTDDIHAKGLSNKGKSRSRSETKQPTPGVEKSGSRGKSETGDKHFAGVPDFFQEGHNITKLSLMLHRAIHEYKIKSMVDVPCRSHSRWMGQLLQHVKPKKGLSFKYFCVDSHSKVLDLAESRLDSLEDVSTNFILRKFWKLPMPKADLVFAWEGLGKMKNRNVGSMLQLLVEGGRHKYFLVGSSPSSKNADGDVLNIRKTPFSYNLPKRIYKQLARGTHMRRPEKHMYLYEISEMKRSK